MNMKRIRTLVLTCLLVLIPSAVNAATFSLTPDAGFVKPESRFTVDVMIDTEGEEVVQARAALSYDASKVKVLKAERNDSLFCTYPDSDQSVDNAAGLVMLSGFCQSGADILYLTGDEPDLFARIEFEVIGTSGDIDLAWEFTGNDEPFNSVIVKDGSPPTNILTKPVDGSMEIDSTALNLNVAQVNTAVGISMGAVIGGVALAVIGIGVLYMNSRPDLERRTKGTVVLYE